MVDCGAIEHVITDKIKFINFEPENHFVNLADEGRVNNSAEKRLRPAFIYAIAKDICKRILKNALYIPLFKVFVISTNNKIWGSMRPQLLNYIFSTSDYKKMVHDTEQTFVLYEKYCFCQKCHLRLTYFAWNLIESKLA